MPNDIKKVEITPAEQLRTWYAKLPGDQMDPMRTKIMEACSWTYDQWTNRIHGRTKLTALERAAIITVIGEDIFFVDQEGDAQP